ncbi:MAG: hypothetical protein OEY44_02765 [Candidatus Peregrinibacteria bacterium]|nr:hypothetical protein [Candidatus Peregrinibacteria bacterium]
MPQIDPQNQAPGNYRMPPSAGGPRRMRQNGPAPQPTPQPEEDERLTTRRRRKSFLRKKVQGSIGKKFASALFSTGTATAISFWFF